MFQRKRKEQKSSKVKTALLQKYQPIFITVDGESHVGCEYKWANDSGLLCSVPKYIMIYIEQDGYMEDKDGIFYPLQNIVSIKWKLLEQKNVADIFSNTYQIFFSDEEVEAMTAVEDEK